MPRISLLGVKAAFQTPKPLSRYQHWLQEHEQAYRKYQILEQQYVQTGYSFFCADCLPKIKLKLEN